MSQARQTELMEQGHPKGNGFAYTLNSSASFTKIHAVTSGNVLITHDDSSTAPMYLLQGHTYDVSGANITANPDTPTITAWNHK